MVGVVVVSHSRGLAEELVKMTMALHEGARRKGISSPVTAAGGVGEGRAELGSDAFDILEAIERVYSPEGVIVFVDVGSTLLSTEVALEMLAPEKAQRVKIAPFPLVEGVLAASLQSLVNSDLQRVIEEAARGLDPKKSLLKDSSSAAHVEALSSERELGQGKGTAKEFVILNEHGLHARPLTRFIQLVSCYSLSVEVENLTRSKGPVWGDSLSDLFLLEAHKGDTIRVRVKGEKEVDFFQELKGLIASRFGEIEGVPASPFPAEQTCSLEAPSVDSDDTDDKNLFRLIEQHEGGLKGKGTPVSPGIGMGEAFRAEVSFAPVGERRSSQPGGEISRLQEAQKKAEKELLELISQERAASGPVKKDQEKELLILETHLILLKDPILLQKATEAIKERSLSAPYAWHEAVEETRRRYLTMKDLYFRERQADLKEIGDLVMRHLLGEKTERLTLREPVVLYGEEVSLSQATQIDRSLLRGIITNVGGRSSHLAIMARTWGVPLVSGMDNLKKITCGEFLVLDGGSGEVWVSPPASKLSELKDRENRRIDRLNRQKERVSFPAVTQDGVSFSVFANVSSRQEAQEAVANGAEGIGLLRTEFLFLKRVASPSEEEQLFFVREILQEMGERPVTVRTFDIGGDKKLPYLDLPEEANPFLGMRGIRVYRRERELFRRHLRAILRAAHIRGSGTSTVKLMLPMVVSLEEVEWAKTQLLAAHEELTAGGIPHAWPLSMGVMIETPSALFLSDVLARSVDFFSLGTNDLLQYLLASERGNEALQDLADWRHPSLLRGLAMLADSARKAKVPVGLCGEMGGDLALLPFFLGAGLSSLSVAPPFIPEVKEAIRELSRKEGEEFFNQLLYASSLSEVKKNLSRECVPRRER